MVTRTAKTQSQHDQIVQTVVSHLAQNGYRNIRAALPGLSQPALLKGTKRDHIPDVTADGVIVEVETGDTIDDPHTASQWSLFSDYAVTHRQSFWVVVPNDAMAAAESRLQALGLIGQVYGV